MSKLEVFFDYACPYCLQGHQNLLDILPDFPDTEVIWRPCESHPRPERYGMHSDLLIQGMFFAQDSGADLWAYHERAYRLILKDRANAEDIDTLAVGFAGLLNPEALHGALKNGKYIKIQRDANRYAFTESGVWVVPAYRMNGLRLDSVENIGVTKDRLKKFLQRAMSSAIPL
ncbi:MAG TPA: hypothetical protein DEQ02_10060 [Ruminococcaceae bacterium]|nr:hypothetical protein [Oscillospiraceae bacterium]